jgi:hypothetical protein
MGACTPKLDLSNRPPPCGDDRLDLCAMTGACVEREANTGAVPESCNAGLSVRQGGEIVLPAPGARLENITVVGMSGDWVTAEARPNADGSVGIHIAAPHGALTGDSVNGQPRVIKITTKLGTAKPFDRFIPVFVSFIVAAPQGSDHNSGVLDSPYESFQQAAKVAEAGDTILLRNFTKPNDAGTEAGDGGAPSAPPVVVDTPGPGSDPRPLDHPLNRGVTVKCLDQLPVVLHMPVDLAGDAVLDNLAFEAPLSIQNAGSDVSIDNTTFVAAPSIQAVGSKVSITNSAFLAAFPVAAPAGELTLQNVSFWAPLSFEAPGGRITLQNVDVREGITIAKNASGTTLDISQQPSSASVRPEIIASGPRIPLHVQADAASVTITGTESVIWAVGPPTAADVDTIFFEGMGQSLSLLEGAHAENRGTSPAIHIKGSTSLFVGSKVPPPAVPPQTRLIAPVRIEGAGSDATFEGVSFAKAPLTFHGNSLTLSKGANLSESPVEFHGETLYVFDTAFDHSGISQFPLEGVPDGMPAMGDAYLMNTTFDNSPYDFKGHELWIQGNSTFRTSPLAFSGALLKVQGASFNNSALTFSGPSLIIQGASFVGQGIVQDYPGSSSTLDGVTISDYDQFGYKLRTGNVDISGGSFAHLGTATPSLDGSAPPWALRVEAPGDSDSSVTTHGTMYDGVPPPATECPCRGATACSGPIVSVTSDVLISLCP